MWDTEDGSMSLSCELRQETCRWRRDMRNTYRHLLLGEDHGTVLAAHAYRHDVRSCDGLEGVLCAARQRRFVAGLPGSQALEDAGFGPP